MQTKRYTIVRKFVKGKFSCYFRDWESGRDLPLEEVKDLLNELDDFKKYVKFVEGKKYK